MSWWGTIEADFRIPRDSKLPSAMQMRREIEEREPHAPTGSEGGPSVFERDRLGDGGIEKWVSVSGRLRDVSDAEDSPLVLAWFVRHARWCDYATLTWDLDSGPRYRWVWEEDELRRLRGVLE